MRRMQMRTLVVYASRYGSTKEIAEFIAGRLRQQGMEAAAESADAAPRAGDYDAVVVGSGVYMGHWLREATEFVRQNRAVLADRPVWLFSSGPLELPAGTESLDDPDLQPAELEELREAVHPRGTRVFFGALDPAQLGFGHRMIRKLPAGRNLLPEGDFRDWDDIAAWADGIARALAVPAA